MAIKNLTVTRSQMQIWANLFWQCYRMGVNDAYQVDDAALCKERLAACDAPGVFVRVNSDWRLEWKEWVHEITKIALEVNRYSFFEDFKARAGRYRSNYLSLFYLMMFEMYCLGVKDYNSQPSACDILMFNHSKNKMWWVFQGRTRILKNRDLKLRIEDIIIRRRRTDAQSDSHLAFNNRHYECFLAALGTLIYKERIY